MIAITVIIPTYHRQARLQRALESLQEQSLDRFEILVVDNAADGALYSFIKQFNQGACHPVRYISEPRLGLHHARHTGSKAARGDLLVYTDDDATFNGNWLQIYQQLFAQYPEMTAAGGPILPRWETPPPEWVVGLMGDLPRFPILSLMRPRNGFFLEPDGVFFGVNMAIRKERLFSLGGFNPDSFGNDWLGDGETGLNRKLWANGELIGFVDQALVYHHIPEERMTVAYFAKRMVNEAACTEYAYFHGRQIVTSLIALRGLKICLSMLFILPLTVGRLIIRRDQYAFLRMRLDWVYQRARLVYLARIFENPDMRILIQKSDWLVSEPQSRLESENYFCDREDHYARF